MENSKKQTGRPRSRPACAIEQLLVAKLPTEFVENGTIVTAKLAEAVPCARYSIYRWLDGKPLSGANAKRLVELSEERKGSLTLVDLLPFLIG